MSWSALPREIQISILTELVQSFGGGHDRKKWEDAWKEWVLPALQINRSFREDLTSIVSKYVPVHLFLAVWTDRECLKLLQNRAVLAADLDINRIPHSISHRFDVKDILCSHAEPEVWLEMSIARDLVSCTAFIAEHWPQTTQAGARFSNFLSAAISSGNMKTAKWLLEIAHNKDVFSMPLCEAMSKYGAYGVSKYSQDSPLEKAIILENVEMLELLLDYDLEIRDLRIFGTCFGNDYGDTAPLTYAAHCDNIPLIDLMLGKRFVIGLEGDDEGLTSPLVPAIRNENLKVIKLLIEHGAQVNNDDRTASFPLGEAVKLGNLEIVDILLEQGADIDEETEDEESALWYAMCSGRKEVVQYLLAKGARPSPNVFNALQKFAEDDRLYVAGMLIDHEAGRIGIEGQGARLGFEALEKLIRDGERELVQLLLENGAMDLIEYPQDVLLNFAVQSNHIEIVAMLLDHGVDPNQHFAWSIDGNSLYRAAAAGFSDIVRLLLSRGANVNAPRHDHRQPIFIALTKGRLECVRILLENGAVVDHEGGPLRDHWNALTAQLDEDTELLLWKHKGDVTKKTRYEYHKDAIAELSAMASGLKFASLKRIKHRSQGICLKK